MAAERTPKENIINSSISKKIAQFQELPKDGSQKCPAYLRLPWIAMCPSNLRNKPNPL